MGVRSGRALCTRMTLERVSIHVFRLSLTARMEEGNNSSQIMDWRYRFVGEYVLHSFNHPTHLGIHAGASGSSHNPGCQPKIRWSILEIDPRDVVPQLGQKYMVEDIPECPGISLGRQNHRQRTSQQSWRDNRRGTHNTGVVGLNGKLGGGRRVHCCK